MNAVETANLTLGRLALLLAIIGTVAWWSAAHPAKVQALVCRVRNYPSLIPSKNVSVIKSIFWFAASSLRRRENFPRHTQDCP